MADFDTIKDWGYGTAIQPREYGGSISISRSLIASGPYGYYQRGGKLRFRNYHRELKNGKGLSLIAIMVDKVSKHNELSRKALMNG